MGESIEELRRRCTYWWRWFGPRRVAATLATIIVGVLVAWWLLRAPVTPTEAQLPLADGATATTTGAQATHPTSSSTTTTPPVTTTGELVVHVTGAVQRPGVYRLATGARVIDAVEAAGGPLVDADPNALNLAAPLTDGDRVAVPREGETVPPTDAPAGDGPVDPHPEAPIDINAASAEDLLALPGVGPATAAAIVEHRRVNGPFATVDDLDDVRGIGPATLEQLRPLVTV